MSTSNHDLRLYAHRGASALLPENTLEAFELALADGATALELDIHRTSDGHFVVAHDPHGLRLAGVPDHICTLCLEDVKRWDVSTTDTRDLGHHAVPTLEEILEAFPNVPMSIDHKPGDPGAVPELLEMLSRHGAEGRVTLASFSGKVMERVRSLGYRGRTALTRQEIVWLRFLPTAIARKYRRRGRRPDPDPLRADPTRYHAFSPEVPGSRDPHRLLGRQRSRRRRARSWMPAPRAS